MIDLEAWTALWGIPREALDDLAATAPSTTPVRGESEAAVQAAVRLDAARRGWLLYRNNSGACQDRSGRHIRYGLANDSKRVNDVFKSSDLIGLRPLEITQEHVGRVIGQFVALECKKRRWVPGKSTGEDRKRELAQLNFMLRISALGGLARFTTGGIPND